jgi:cell division protein FtsB
VLHWALGSALVLGCLSVADARGFRRHFRLERQIAALGERNTKVEEENRALRREIEGLRKDPKALERAAREELGFIKPGEVIINLE